MRTRLEKLKDLVDSEFNGSHERLAQAIGRPSSQVILWTSGFSELSNEDARYIETQLGLHQGSLDTDVPVRNKIKTPASAKAPEKEREIQIQEVQFALGGMRLVNNVMLSRRLIDLTREEKAELFLKLYQLQNGVISPT